MPKGPLRWRLFLTYVVVVLVTLVLSIWIGSVSLHRLQRSNMARDLEDRAHVVQDALAGFDPVTQAAELDSACKRIGADGATRITVILPSGKVVADSQADPLAVGDHGGRPEVRDALAGRIGVAVRHSSVKQDELMYVALPVTGSERLRAVVRVSLPVAPADRAWRAFAGRTAIAGVGVLLAASLLAFFVARTLARPLDQIRRGVQRFAAGDLSHRIVPAGSDEEVATAEAMNRLGQEMETRITDLERRNREQATLFASMQEGVVAVDSDERVITLNPAAARFFGVELSGAAGRHLQEVIRNSALQRFVRDTLRAAEVTEAELVVRDRGEDRYVQARGSPLRGAEGEEIGVLVVLEDVTRLRRLEIVRRDFVANVSHELRTPVTSIKGFLETLRDGDLTEPDRVRRFVAIAARHAGRLHAIIEDLLALSRIEQDAERSEIVLERRALRPALEAAVRLCQGAAADRPIGLEVICAPDLEVHHSPTLIEQALVNLIDNAITYSSPGQRVTVEAVASDGGVAIRVTDRGVGIPREHHERIFERFYTVDKGRSRAMGGTGLGLAIVKHIALAHGGSVEVESSPGAGSTFTIRLPGPAGEGITTGHS